jgi:hypothetical protein
VTVLSLDDVKKIIAAAKTIAADPVSVAMQIFAGVACIKVEPDIDYFKDLGAHTLLEVIPNSITHGLTDPKRVYVLRWIAGKHAGVPEFIPPYTIAA